ncbi:hypothetical protein DVH05_012003 [Phytophthora capsici]|nr:hypothetical protein DVH05_012003 [Phytophthora capsici]
MHKQHWHQPRDAAATRIQRNFRGWRTRRYIVHQVREDMELLVAGIRRQLEGEWPLLGPTAASMTLDWGSDERLRLPRMEDSFFGVSVSFPLIETDEEQHEDGQHSEAGGDSAQEATDSLPSPDKTVIAPLQLNLDDALEDSPPAWSSGDTSPFVGAQASQETNIKTVAACRISDDTNRRDARVSAVEIRGDVLQAESTMTQRQTDNGDNVLLKQSKDANTQLDCVNQILATHSRADILLELEWARQALRDRRKYLRSRRVGRGLDLT